jgi:hypothetical protein
VPRYELSPKRLTEQSNPRGLARMIDYFMATVTFILVVGGIALLIFSGDGTGEKHYWNDDYDD